MTLEILFWLLGDLPSESTSDESHQIRLALPSICLRILLEMMDDWDTSQDLVLLMFGTRFFGELILKIPSGNLLHSY